LERIREGAAGVVVKGQTEHQCQVQLVPLFMERAAAAGTTATNAGLGRLRVGECDVYFEPLFSVRQ
jgi:hypothetical protein